MAHDPETPYQDDGHGPMHRHRVGDHLYYIHPLTGERWLAVSTVLDMHANEDLDHRWRPAQAAEAAFRQLPKVLAASITPMCGRTHGKCSRNDTRSHDWRERCADCPCDVCKVCVIKFLTYEHYRQSTRATERGTAVHRFKDFWIARAGDTASAWDEFNASYARLSSVQRLALVETIRPYVDSFRRFVDDYGLTWQSWAMTEATIINRTHGYAGTLDGQIRLDATTTKKALEMCERIGVIDPIVTEDTKSREKNDAALYPEMAKQLAAYRRGETILLDDGTEIPLPPTSHAAILQLRPEGYTFRLMVTDDPTFGAFLGNLADARWTIELGNESTLVKSFPRQPLVGLPEPVKPPPRKRAPAKKTTPALAKAAKAAPQGQRPSTRAGRPPLARYVENQFLDAQLPIEDVPLPVSDVDPEPPSTIAEVAARQSATLRSMMKKTTEPDPRSPYKDNIPF